MPQAAEAGDLGWSCGAPFHWVAGRGLGLSIRHCDTPEPPPSLLLCEMGTGRRVTEQHWSEAPVPQCPANPTTIQRTNTRRNERTRADRRRQAAARRSEQQLRRGLHGFAPASLLGPRRLRKFSVCVCARGLQWAMTWGTNDLSPCPPASRLPSCAPRAGPEPAAPQPGPAPAVSTTSHTSLR